jgi:hypothetical protein
MADYSAHPVEHGFCMLSGVDVPVIMVMGSVAMDVRMCVFVTGLIYMRMFVKMLVCMFMAVFVCI